MKRVYHDFTIVYCVLIHVCTVYLNLYDIHANNFYQISEAESINLD